MEDSMNKLKTHLIVWLAGLIAGLILMERWQRQTDLQLLEDGVDDADETKAERTPAKALADAQPRVTTVIVAGAKADAERARQLLVRMTPWKSNSAPSLAQRRRSSDTPSSADTSDSSADGSDSHPL